MNILNSIAAFISENKAAFAIAFAWFVREWTTVGGLTGLKSWFLTGKISKAVSKQEQQQPPKQT
jgi:hypothetical protein